MKLHIRMRSLPYGGRYLSSSFQRLELCCPAMETGWRTFIRHDHPDPMERTAQTAMNFYIANHYGTDIMSINFCPWCGERVEVVNTYVSAEEADPS